MENVDQKTHYNTQERNSEELFMSQAIKDLKQGLYVYVYRDYILSSLMLMFKNLEVKRYDFYWEVKLGGKE